MYAIIETGSKQYTVSPGDEIKVEKINGGVGDLVTFDKVLTISDDDGTLHTGRVSGRTVSGTISGHGRHKKIDVFKFKRRKMYRRRIGHRQSYTQVRIDSIESTELPIGPYKGFALPELENADDLEEKYGSLEEAQSDLAERNELPDQPQAMTAEDDALAHAVGRKEASPGD